MTAVPNELDQVCCGIAHVLDLNPAVLRADTPLSDLGSDAVSVLAVVGYLQQRFNISVNAQGVKSAVTVADLAAAMSEPVPGRGDAAK